MKQRLTKKEYLFVASLLFGLVFGAGNLIFPASMGQRAGMEMLPALVGFCITGVGLPLLGIAAISITASDSLSAIGNRVGRRFSLLFTCALYLCIGPLFAIPRTATVSFQVGVLPFVAPPLHDVLLLVFTFLFFAVVLFFSLRPSGILIWIGKVLNPLFLFFLAVMIVAALREPMGSVWTMPPAGAYAENAFFTGLLEGYNTMDVLAALAYGSILVDSIRRLGLSSPADLSYSTIISGSLSTLLMALIYLALTYVGAQSRAVCGIDANGGDVLAHIAAYYFGRVRRRMDRRDALQQPASGSRSPVRVSRPPLDSSRHVRQRSPCSFRAGFPIQNTPCSSPRSRSPYRMSVSAASSRIPSPCSTFFIPSPSSSSLSVLSRG